MIDCGEHRTLFWEKGAMFPTFPSPERQSKHFLTVVFFNLLTVSVELQYCEFCSFPQCRSINYKCTVWLWEAEFGSLAHWSPLDRQICIVSYSDTILSMQYLWYIHSIVLQYGNLYCMYHTIATYYNKLKKAAISRQCYTFEYLTWHYEAKTYVNSILREVFSVYHTSV